MDLTPLYGLRLRTSRLELRFPDEGQVLALAELAGRGIHPPEEMPFSIAWTDATETFTEDFLAYYRGARAEWAPGDWKLELAVFSEGELVGVQGMRAVDFATARRVETGSWLGQAFQGRGYGTEMRAAILEFAFIGLGALEAGSGAMDFNIASQRISEKLGYEQVGEEWVVVRADPQLQFMYVITRDRFLSAGPHHVRMAGVEECRHLFGAVPV